MSHAAAAQVGNRRLTLKSTGKALELRIRVELATTPGCRFWKHNTPKMKGTAARGRIGLGVGVSDLLGIVTMSNGAGRFCALEVKDGKGRPDANQRRFLATVARFGGFACVVRSVEEAREAVERARAC